MGGGGGPQQGSGWHRPDANQAATIIDMQSDDDTPPPTVMPCAKKPIMYLGPPLDFKIRIIDGKESVKSVTVKNIGAKDLDVSSVKLSFGWFGGSKKYYELRDAGTPFTLPPGASKIVKVALLHKKIGKWSCSVQAQSNCSRKPKQSVAVVGELRGWIAFKLVDNQNNALRKVATLSLEQQGQQKTDKDTAADGSLRIEGLHPGRMKVRRVGLDARYELVDLTSA